MQEYIKIRDKNIPIVVRNYKTSKHLKMYFKADVLYVSKPRYVSMKKALEFIKQNEKFVYEKYTDLSENKNFKTKSWISGDVFSYLGEKYVVKADICNENKININLDQSNKMIKLSYPISIAENEEKRKYYIDRGIKQILKNNTRYYPNIEIRKKAVLDKMQKVYMSMNEEGASANQISAASG